MKDEVEEILDISNNTHENLQDEIIGPRVTSTFRKQETEKERTDGYQMLLVVYARPPFRDFESYLRIVVGLDENGIHIFLKQCISIFFTFELSLGLYTIKDISAAVYTMSDHEKTLQTEYDDFKVKTKFLLTHFGTLRFDIKSFLEPY